MLPARAGEAVALPALLRTTAPTSPTPAASSAELCCCSPCTASAAAAAVLAVGLPSTPSNHPPDTLLLLLRPLRLSSAAAAGAAAAPAVSAARLTAAEPSAAGAVDGQLLAANRLSGRFSPVLLGLLLSAPAPGPALAGRPAADRGLLPRARDVLSGDKLPTARPPSPVLLPPSGLPLAPAVLPSLVLNGRLGLMTGSVRGTVVRLAIVLASVGCRKRSAKKQATQLRNPPRDN